MIPPLKIAADADSLYCRCVFHPADGKLRRGGTEFMTRDVLLLEYDNGVLYVVSGKVIKGQTFKHLQLVRVFFWPLDFSTS